jgi:hypothetical protein
MATHFSRMGFSAEEVAMATHFTGMGFSAGEVVMALENARGGRAEEAVVLQWLFDHREVSCSIPLISSVGGSTGRDFNHLAVLFCRLMRDSAHQLI